MALNRGGRFRFTEWRRVRLASSIPRKSALLGRTTQLTLHRCAVLVA